MAISIISQVWQYPHLRDQSQLLVMLALADFSNEHGEAYPSISTLADRARVTERHVRKILSHFRTHDLIKIDQCASPAKDPWKRSNVYTINLSRLMDRKNGIPFPDYKEEKQRAKRNKEKKAIGHNDTPITPPVVATPPVTVTPPPLSQEAETPQGPPVTVTSKPSEEEENRQREPSITPKPPRGSGRKKRALSYRELMDTLEPTLLGGPCPQVQESMMKWVNYRNQIGKPISPAAFQETVDDAESMGSDRFAAAVKHSIKNDWQGLFEPKTVLNAKPSRNPDYPF